MDKSCFH